MNISTLRWFLFSLLMAAALGSLGLIGNANAGATKAVGSGPDATPGSGTLPPSGPNVTWTGFAPLVLATSVDETTCIEGVNCDTFTLTLSGTPADWVGKRARLTISWANSADDFDVFVRKGTTSGPLVGSAANSGGGPETVELDPGVASVGTGTFTVRVVYFLVNGGLTHNYQGTASAVTAAVPTPTPSPGATPTPTPVPPGIPRFVNHYAPPGVMEDAGEPTMGVN